MTLSFITPRETLLSLVERVARVVEKRNTVPILNNIMMVAEAEGLLTLRGTDLEILAVASTADVEVTEPGGTTLEADLFLAAIKRSPAGKAKFAADDRNASLTVGRSRSSFPTMPIEDFPPVALRPGTHDFSIPSVDLAAVFDKCSFAMSTDSATRFFLCGINMHADDDALVAIATDGHRMARMALDLPKGAEHMPGIIIPAKMARIAAGLSGKSDQPVTVSASQEFIRIEIPGLIIQSRLIDHPYRDYSELFPADLPHEATTPVAALRGVVDRVLLYAPEKDRDMRCDFIENAIAIKTRSQRGETSDEIEAECGFDMTIGFNAKYMQEMLSTFEGEMINFGIGDIAGQAVLCSEPRDPRRKCLLMPVAVKN